MNKFLICLYNIINILIFWSVYPYIYFRITGFVEFMYYDILIFIILIINILLIYLINKNHIFQIKYIITILLSCVFINLIICNINITFEFISKIEYKNIPYLKTVLMNIYGASVYAKIKYTIISTLYVMINYIISIYINRLIKVTDIFK